MKFSISRGLAAVGLATLLVAAQVAFTGCGEPLSAEQSLAATAPEQDVGIGGTWQINLELSDRPAGRMGNRDGRGPAGRPGARQGRPNGRRGQGPPPKPVGERGGTLTIGVESDAVTLSRGNGSTLTITTDGQPVIETVGRGEVEVEVTATWDEGSLVIVRNAPRGVLTETFALAGDGSQLYVDSVMEDDRSDEPLEFRRVYDRVE